MTKDITVGTVKGIYDSGQDEADVLLSDLTPELQALAKAALALRNGCADPPCIPDWGDCTLHEALNAAANGFSASVLEKRR